MNKLIIVAGPTASGKTNYAIKLAKEVDGELINADSRQIYKYLNIGTNVGHIKKIAKLSHPISHISSLSLPLHSIDGIPIHLLQYLNPDERFSVFQYKELAEATILDVISRGKVPILVGGTGLYIDAIVKGYQLVESLESRAESNKELQITNVACPEEVRELREKLETLSVLELQNTLTTHSPGLLASLNNSDKNNPRRLIRLIEKLSVVSNQLSEQEHVQCTSDDEVPDPTSHITYLKSDFDTHASFIDDFDVTFYYPMFNWEELKIKINDRVEEMFKDGFVEETKRVLEMGFAKDSIALQGIGYKQVLDYLEKKVTLDQCIELVKIAHRQYARRQRTWFEGENRNYELQITNYK